MKIEEVIGLGVLLLIAVLFLFAARRTKTKPWRPDPPQTPPRGGTGASGPTQLTELEDSDDPNTRWEGRFLRNENDRRNDETNPDDD